MNGKPLSQRQAAQLLALLTLLAWATQTLIHQWGFGQDVRTAAAGDAQSSVSNAGASIDPVAGADPDTAAPVRFVPNDGGPVGGTLEMKGEAIVSGGDVKLKQVCRWSDGDAAVFAPIAELAVAHVPTNTMVRSLGVDDLRQTLRDAGVNVAVINFVGSRACTVTRGDSRPTEQTALQQWLDSHQAPTTAPATPAAPTATDAKPASDVQAFQPLAASRERASAPRSLREILLADAAERLGIPTESLQIDFSLDDAKLLELREPYFRFSVTPDRVRDLGRVAWDVTIVTDGGNKKVSVEANARAWFTQVMLTQPLAYKQVLRDGDVTQKRVLLDHLPDDPLLTEDQAVGQQASRDLKPGTVLTGRLVDPVPLVRPGQLVTITLQQGSVQVRTVARAREGGAYGQTIKVVNEATKDTYEVVVSGPQAARMTANAGGAGAAAAADASPVGN